MRGAILASLPAILVVVAVLSGPYGRSEPPRAAVRAGALAREGLDLISHDKHAAAAMLASEAIEADPRSPLPHLVFAWAMESQGAPPPTYLSSAKEAVTLARAADDRETYYFARASYWQMKGDLAQAARDYETLLKLTPDHYWGLNNLLGIYETVGRDEWRLLAVRRADARPQNVTDQVVAARVLFIAGDPAGAERYADRACHALSESRGTETSFGEPWACSLPAYARWIDGRVSEVPAAVMAVVRRTGLQRPERDMALHTVLGPALGIGDWALAELAASSIEDAPTRLQDQAAIALVRGEWAVARRLVMDESVGTATVTLTAAAIMSDVGLGGSVLDRFGVAPSDSSTDAEYLRAEQSWSERRYAEAMQHLRRTMSGPSGAFTGTGGRSTVALLRSLMMMADDEERREKLTDAIVHLEKARALRREACLGDPLAPAYWLRAQVKLATLYRRAGRREQALMAEGDVNRLSPHGARSIFYTRALYAHATGPQ